MKTILFATSNEGKIREAQQILGLGIQPVQVETDEIQTLDPIECVQKKGLSAFAKLKKPVLVEDTTLFIEALNGLPGVFIDYFMKALGNEGILRILKNMRNRFAYAQTTLCYVINKGKSVIVSGKIEGKIALKSRGDNGFGWDPIFIPKGYNHTFAEMTDETKNRISMRKKALKNLKTKLARLSL